MPEKLSKVMVFITVILMDLLTGMEFDLFVPSFPELQSQFNLTPFWVEALLSINFAGYSLGMFLVGGLADRYGRKPIILLGVISFIFGSMICLWTHSYQLFLLGRFLQGVGISAPSILSFLIIADAYSIKQQQFLLAMLNGVMNVSVAAAPVVGSYVTLYFHWQGNFSALLILGVFTLLMTLIFIPSHPLPAHKDTLSLRGYIPIFQSKPLRLLIVNIIFFIVPYWVFVGMSPLLFMESFGVSLAHFGYYQGSLALIFALGSVIFGLVMHRFNQRKMLVISLQIFIASLVLIAAVTVFDSRNPLLITLAFLPFVLGQVIPSTILFPVCLNFLTQYKGRVAALIQGGRLILSAVGVQIAGLYYTGSFQNIGMIICGFIIVGVVTLYYVIENQELIAFSQK